MESHHGLYWVTLYGAVRGPYNIPQLAHMKAAGIISSATQACLVCEKEEWKNIGDLVPGMDRLAPSDERLSAIVKSLGELNTKLAVPQGPVRVCDLKVPFDSVFTLVFKVTMSFVILSVFTGIIIGVLGLIFKAASGSSLHGY